MDRRQVRSMTDWTLFELSSSSSIVIERLPRRVSCDVELSRWPTGSASRGADVSCRSVSGRSVEPLAVRPLPRLMLLREADVSVSLYRDARWSRPRPHRKLLRGADVSAR